METDLGRVPSAPARNDDRSWDPFRDGQGEVLAVAGLGRGPEELGEHQPPIAKRGGNRIQALVSRRKTLENWSAEAAVAKGRGISRVNEG